MNRRWPIVASWVFVGATGVGAAAGLVFGEIETWISLPVAATATAQLCVQRHIQHGLAATFIMVSVLGACLAPTGPLTTMSATSLVAFALLIGSRGVARWFVRNRQAPTGIKVMLLTGGIFGLSALSLVWLRVNPDWPIVSWRLPVLVAAAGLAGVLAQVFSTPWLVKVIPESKPDDRPSIVLWALLIALVAADGLIRQGLVTFTR